MTMKNGLALAVSAIVLLQTSPAWAASKAEKRKATTEAILSGQKSGLVYYRRNCGYTLTNQATGEKLDWGTRKKFNVIAVDPGTYRYAYIGCESYQVKGKYRFNTKEGHLWFHDIEVKAGEVLYPSSPNGFAYAYKPEGLYIEGPFKTHPETFPTFERISFTKDVRKKMEEKFPDLLDLLQVRLSGTRVDKTELIKKIKAVYQPGSEGEKVKFSVANRKAKFLYSLFVKAGTKPVLPAPPVP